MRTSAEIFSEMKNLESKNRAFSAIYSEGCEGYQASGADLLDEYLAAKAAEFSAEWTVETLAARRVEWNAAVAPLVAAGKPVNPATVRAIEKNLGYKLADIQAAKLLRGVA